MPASTTASRRDSPELGTTSPKPRVKKVVPLKYRSVSRSLLVSIPDRPHRPLQRAKADDQNDGPGADQEEEQRWAVQAQNDFPAYVVVDVSRDGRTGPPATPGPWPVSTTPTLTQRQSSTDTCPGA